ncbi:MAG: CbiX/SirB N-terminal domain-containing protein [Mariprofundaceae bacterium]|nr:CbiX/SirB N-terminal domain-containing protein [Mariprofundaceae bacterium]
MRIQQMLSGTEVLLLAHGSKYPDYGAACETFLAVWNRSSGLHARLCFLEQCEPLLEDLLAAVAAHSHSIAILPLLLNAGIHLRQDIPDRLAAFKQHHSEIKIYPVAGLTDVGAITEALNDRAIEAHADVQSIILLTHGSRQNSVQQHVMQLVDMLAARTGKNITVAFSGYGIPSLEGALKKHAGASPVVVTPHFIFPGGWWKQACADMDTFRHAHPGVELILAKPLGAHLYILKLLQQQLRNL